MATCASLTTGTTVFMADPCKDNTLAKNRSIYRKTFLYRIGKELYSAVLNTF